MKKIKLQEVTCKKIYHINPQGKPVIYENVTVVWNHKGIVQKIILHQEPKNIPQVIGVCPWVDCHTHTLFAGNRAHEFLLKAQGATYAQIASQGGGILFTQQQTAQTSASELKRLIEGRLKLMLKQGVRGVEIKTGYGLEHSIELAHLKILNELKKKWAPQMRLWITYMGPHAIPKGRGKQEYLSEICTQTLPQIAKQKLADFVDIFIDDGFFSVEDAHQYFTAARKHGLRLKAHIDELTNLAAAELSNEFKITSVDHCLKTTPEQIALLQKNKVTPVLLPATSFYLNETFDAFLRFKAAGVLPAIASDYNPGSQPGLNYSFLIHLAFKKLGMNETEVLGALTTQALRALAEKPNMWALQVGQPLKLAIYQAGSLAELGYRYGENLHQQTIFY